MVTTKNQLLKFFHQNYLHLKNLNVSDSRTGSREKDLLIGYTICGNFYLEKQYVVLRMNQKGLKH